ncbi:MAG: DUF29 domain-containing protein [Microcystis aeruginosa Ma_QC_Ch_20071001_S25]|uniref:DUF29 domain-containing protein n=1 Tax=Microcystis aeruginosa Ma_QC_Ch_20071001_S25D TaxID=2486250 RepID=A0A552FVM9_MICAE|nr:MAG: DUF29 domain-containing protein [Microcystis aeruginosa Ma_QC_Ch_20071001_S25D]TRU52673.1 MAG: DUF29 domain-containing protein [Microcystis aeruginosa Ma_QC_Ch_20071001_S25]
MKTLNQNPLQVEGGENLPLLYEIDQHFWLEKTIKILQENRLDELDVIHLIEELESLSKRDKNRVSSLLEQVIRHLLLLQYWTTEAEINRNHWRAEIISFRSQLRKYLTTNLQDYLAEELPIIYQDALAYVQEKTGFSSNFPPECPYSLEQLLDKNWFNCED